MERVYFENINTLEFIWDLLSLNLTKTKLAKHRINSTKFHDISFCYHQSKELFESALKLTYSTFPLPQYYSFNLLTKILILVFNRNKKIESLEHAHGLSAIEIVFKNNRDIENLSSISVKVNEKGTFCELLKTFNTTQEIEYLCSERINLEEILKRIIDIYGFGETNQLIPVHDFKEELIDADNLVTSIDFPLEAQRSFNLPEIRERYPDFKYFQNESFDPRSSSILNGRFITKRNKDSKPEIFAEFTPFGKVYLSSFFKSNEEQNVYLNQIEICFIFSFICSSLVRYYPDLWEKILANDDRYWLLKKALKSIFTSFPNHILSKILGKKVIFWPSNELEHLPYGDE